MEDLRQAISEWLDYQAEKQAELDRRYSPNPPHDTCKTVFMKGLMIENSFGPQVGELNPLFETEYEKLFVWTHDKNAYSAITIDVNLEVKNISFWKNIGNIIWMAWQYSKAFEGISTDQFEYKWIYDFDPQKVLSEQVFNNLAQFDDVFLKSGTIIKVTDIADLAPEIELMLRDDKAYTALMMLCNSFLQHYICLICELSSHPYHDHLSQEPQIWEHAWLIPNMEAAIVQACRSVEGILGEPPNSKKQAAVLKHKEKWIALTGINPDEIYRKANTTYLDFYYKLFFELRNPSAHSYGNIHFELEKSKAVEAQCFAAILVRDYFHKHMLELEDAQMKLNFNMDLFARVSDDMSTKSTK